jgi:hypothetical protein
MSDQNRNAQSSLPTQPKNAGGVDDIEEGEDRVEGEEDRVENDNAREAGGGRRSDGEQADSSDSRRGSERKS